MKSAQFPRTWKVGTEYHTAGQELLGQTTDNTEKVVTVDGLLVSHVGIYDLDDAMSHYDAAMVYMQELGKAMGRTFDRNIMRQIILAAREAVTSPFPSGFRLSGDDITGSSISTGFDLWEAIRAGRVNFLDKNVPEDIPVWAALSPTNFDKLKFATDSNGHYLIANRDFNSQVGGTSQRAVQSLEVEDVTVLRSNLIPSTDQSADTSVFSKYRADYSSTIGLMWCPEAIGTVELLGMRLETDRDSRRQENFFVAKQAVGHGAVRNECSIEITNLTTA